MNKEVPIPCSPALPRGGGRPIAPVGARVGGWLDQRARRRRKMKAKIAPFTNLGQAREGPRMKLSRGRGRRQVGHRASIKAGTGHTLETSQHRSGCE